MIEPAGILEPTFRWDPQRMGIVRKHQERVLHEGLGVFTLGSVGAALAPSVEALNAARAVQGLGGAVVMPLTLTLLSAAVPPEKRGLALGAWGGVGGLAVPGGLEAAVQRPGLAEGVGGVPDTGAETGEEGGAEGGGLDDLRALHGYADLVGLHLAQEVVGGRAAVALRRHAADEGGCGVVSVGYAPGIGLRREPEG